MSFFSWIIVFAYSLKSGGNPYYGLLALIGIMFAHLATNLFDDICDYKKLSKVYNGKIELPNTQRGKCAYFINGLLTTKQALLLFMSYCIISLLIGLFFVFKIGVFTLILAGIGALIVLLYSFLSYHSMSEIAVGAAFGPLLFEGVYYVMTGNISIAPVILSLPSMFFTINLLFTDTFMDKDIDKNEGKLTLVNKLGAGKKALAFQKLIVTFGYLSTLLLPALNICGIKVLSVFLTLPLAVDLAKSLELYLETPDKLPQKRWYHFPFEAWEDIKQNRSVIFMFRMYQARNLMMYVSVILTVSVLWT